MKKVFFILFSMCFATAMMAQTDSLSVEIDKIFKVVEHDFGTLKQSSTPSVYKFEYVNVGDKPLIIMDTKVSCGCTVAEYSKEPVKPGKKAYIKVGYSTKDRPGFFRKNITVITNYGTKTLTIKGTVKN